MLLVQDRKKECLEDVAHNFLGILAELGISLPKVTSARLLKIIKDLIEIKYFTTQLPSRPYDIDLEGAGSSRSLLFSAQVASPKSPLVLVSESSFEDLSSLGVKEMSIDDVKPSSPSPSKREFVRRRSHSFWRSPSFSDSSELQKSLPPVKYAPNPEPEFLIRIPEACTDLSIIQIPEEQLAALAEKIVSILSLYRDEAKEAATLATAAPGLSAVSSPFKFSSIRSKAT